MSLGAHRNNLTKHEIITEKTKLTEEKKREIILCKTPCPNNEQGVSVNEKYYSI